MMRARTFRSILDECLVALRQGETVEACLARYPRHADRLRPLLLLAQQVARAPEALPRPWARQIAWDRVRERAADLRSGGRRWRVRVNFGAWLRPLAVAMALVLAIVSAGGATALAAQDALPDSPLYSVKLWTEDARLWFVFDKSHEAEILLDQSEARVDEINSMVRKDERIPANVLSALKNRNERAAAILSDRPSAAALQTRLRDLSAQQETVLIAFWDQVSDSARDEYGEALAFVHNTRLQGTGALVLISAEDLAGGVRQITGEASPIGDGSWDVGGIKILVDERTIGRSDLQRGKTAQMVVAVNASGEYRALTLSTLRADLAPSGAVVSGKIEAVTDSGIWLTGGQFIPFSSETIRSGQLKVGERVEITVETTSGGSVASSVKTAGATATAMDGVAFTFEGSIESDVSAKSGDWQVGGLTFQTSGATIDAKAGKAEKGARVQIEATAQDDEFLATNVTVLASDADPASLQLVGTYQGTSDGAWIVSSVRVVPSDGELEPPEDSIVALDVRRQGADLAVVDHTVVEQPRASDAVRLMASIKDIQGNVWDLEIGDVRITSVTKISGEGIVGARALVWGRRAQSGALEASYIRVLDTTPVAATPTPAPAPSATPTPVP